MNKRRIGTFYEQMVIGYIEAKGLRIVEKNYRCRYGEVDIIAWDQEILVVIEVKYRSNIEYGHPSEVILAKKRRTITKVTQYYVWKHNIEAQVRFDVVAIYDNEINWFKNAFETC